MKKILCITTAIMMILLFSTAPVFAAQPFAVPKESPKLTFTDLKEFTAKTLDGKEADQKIFEDKDVTILNIWATWCGYCVEEFPDFAEYAQSLPDNVGLVLFCVDGQESAQQAAEILELTGLAKQEVMCLTEGTGDLETLSYQAVFMPTTIFINSKGEVVGETLIGLQKDLSESLDKQIAQILETETKAEQETGPSPEKKD